MTLDLSDLQCAIFKLEIDIDQLRDDAAQLRRTADAAALQFPSALDVARAFLMLPPEIVMQRPDEVVGYLYVHPDLRDMVGPMAVALVEEFRGERSEIKLVVYRDYESDERSLTYYVRLEAYDDDTLMPRLDAISRRFDDRFTQTSDFILITSDYHPME
jgi:hypothetical protein